MTTNIIRSSVKNPCPVCNRTKDGDCSHYSDGLTVMCKTYVDGSGHDESKWHYTGVNELGFQGKFVLKQEPEFKKKPRQIGTRYFEYPTRDGKKLARVRRIDFDDKDKDTKQQSWNGAEWISKMPKEMRSPIPIYRYTEVRDAIERNEQIFIVEGEMTADASWELGIPAATTIGGSGGYTNYGTGYSEDLKGARLILAPDRDANGLKYITNFERDFPTQIEGYYLAGFEGLWKNPQGGMDIYDDIQDRKYTKEQILERIITPEKYRDLTTKPEAQSLENDGGRPHFSTSWEGGLKWETTELDSEGKSKPVSKSVGNHLEAIAYCESPDGTGAGILIEFRTQRGKTHRVLVPRGTLTGDGSEALRFLADRGYHFHRKQKQLLLDYLFGLGCEAVRVYTIADKTGWVNGSFLTPAKTYGDPDLRFREPEPDTTLTETKGTLDGWKSDVAAKCEGNSRLIFSLGTAFSAPLLKPAQIESGGFHLVGTTSIGKTTSLYVAASVAGLKNLPTWRSTSNALEGKAAEFNHMLLPLDELNQADPQTVGASAYMLGNGQGKARMTKNLTNTKPKTWELLFLSTGEVSMMDYLRQAKITAKGGMEARMPSIPADAGKGYGAFENIHAYDTPKSFVDALETSIRQHQGTALDEYLTQLVDARTAEGFDKELRERVHAIASSLSQQFNDTAIGRVAVRFALVQAGLEQAYSFGLLPFPIEQCRWAVKQMFTAWVNLRGGEGSSEIKEACKKIEYLLVTNQHSDRIADPKDPNRIVRNLLAYKIGDTVTDDLEYCVPTAVFNKELADGVDKDLLIAELLKREWLKPSTEKYRASLQRKIDGKKIRAYVFCPFWQTEKHMGTMGTNFESVDKKGFEAQDLVPTPENNVGTYGYPHDESEESVPIVPTPENDMGIDWIPLESTDSKDSSSWYPEYPEYPYKNELTEIEPKFKVGDRVHHNQTNRVGTIAESRTRKTPKGTEYVQYRVDFGFDSQWLEDVALDLEVTQ